MARLLWRWAMEKGEPGILCAAAAARQTARSSTVAWGWGIVIQTITQTGAVLTAFSLGADLGICSSPLPPGANPFLQLFWLRLDPSWMFHSAETMALCGPLSLCELFRRLTQFVLSDCPSSSLGVFSIATCSMRRLSILLMLLGSACHSAARSSTHHFMTGKGWPWLVSRPLVDPGNCRRAHQGLSALADRKHKDRLSASCRFSGRCYTYAWLAQRRVTIGMLTIAKF